MIMNEESLTKLKEDNGGDPKQKGPDSDNRKKEQAANICDGGLTDESNNGEVSLLCHIFCQDVTDKYPNWWLKQESNQHSIGLELLYCLPFSKSRLEFFTTVDVRSMTHLTSSLSQAIEEKKENVWTSIDILQVGWYPNEIDRNHFKVTLVEGGTTITQLLTLKTEDAKPTIGVLYKKNGTILYSVLVQFVWLCYNMIQY